jgi:hypothetical protein
MAMTEFGPNHPLAVRLWAKRLFVESLRETFIDRFIGTSDTNAIIQMRDELNKSAGDRVTFGLRLQLVGTGVSGDNTLEGNEEALQTYNDTIIIDQLRHAVRSRGKMSEQRVPFNVRQESMDGLKDWWADRIDTWFFNQAGGFTAQTDVRYTGMQAVLAPDATHIFRPNAKTTDESLTTGDEFSLAHIDRMIARAKTFNSAGGGAVPIRRAVLCGAQAVAMATGRDGTGPEKMNWVEELFDYNNQLGVAAGMIAGMKKTQFNSMDFGVIVFSTYAPQP